MTIRSDVDYMGVHFGVWIALGAIAGHHRTLTSRGLTVTSLRRPRGAYPSRHAPEDGRPVLAADLARDALDDIGAAEMFCSFLRNLYGGALNIRLVPEELSARELELRGGVDQVEPHVHVELRVAQGILGF